MRTGAVANDGLRRFLSRKVLFGGQKSARASTKPFPKLATLVCVGFYLAISANTLRSLKNKRKEQILADNPLKDFFKERGHFEEGKEII